MKKLLTAGAIVLGVSLATAMVVQASGSRDHWDLGDWRDWWADIGGDYNASYGREVTIEADDGWDVTMPRARAKCRLNKRKCVEIASNIAYNMAASGAYADLNDDQFAQLATRVAAHIVDSVYDHDQTSPLAP